MICKMVLNTLIHLFLLFRDNCLQTVNTLPKFSRIHFSQTYSSNEFVALCNEIWNILKTCKNRNIFQNFLQTFLVKCLFSFMWFHVMFWLFNKLGQFGCISTLDYFIFFLLFENSNNEHYHLGCTKWLFDSFWDQIEYLSQN